MQRLSASGRFSLHGLSRSLLLPACLLPALLMPQAHAQTRLASELNIPAAVPGQPRSVDQIAAVVNNEVITRVELRNRLRSVEIQMTAQKTPLPAREILERQVLERMIVERAQIQLARESGLRIDDTQLDRAITRIAEGNGMTVQQFRDRIEAEGTPFARFREEVRDEILMTRLREREVDSRVQVSESEVDQFLEAQTQTGASGRQELNVAQILIRVPEQATPEQIDQQRKRAEDVIRQLGQGGDFARLAASYSDGSDALTGGELGWRAQDRLPQLFVDALAAVQPGQLAPLVKSSNGFHILKLVGRRSAGDAPASAPIQQTRARHILLRVTELVSSQQARERLLEIKQRIENKSTTFEDMARQYSADGSASRGGELGLLLQGDTVPEFERAMNALTPGQVSDPVESPFGWHLIQVIERKTGDLPQERQRMQARQVLRERKIEESYQDWLRQSRDRAYVDVRLDEK